MGEPTVNEAEARERLVSLFDDGVFLPKSMHLQNPQTAMLRPWQDSELSAVLPFMRFSQNVSVNGGAVSVAQCSKKLKKDI
ncbi:MAG: hypothetical protein L6V88_06240 [Anaerotruncus sp.]|nr:MAG: hypothetical protein L6V88_06240 [Anaerotruncus sp.]